MTTQLRQRFSTLSPRQRLVASLLIEGLTNRQIAARLGTSVHTIKAHRAELMRRMEAKSFAELVSQIRLLQIESRIKNTMSRKTNPLNIIVVEDDQWYRDYLTINLIDRGFQATGAADGREFDQLWENAPADIVILDIDLGHENESGIDIASRLDRSHCGIVLVTGRARPEYRIEGLSAGADSYLSKPVRIDELVLTLANLGRRIR